MNKQELDKLKSFPLHLSWGLQSLHAELGISKLTATVTDEMINPAGAMHGGLIYALCDVAAYSALLSIVDESVTGVTHQINVQVLRPVNLGDHLTITGTVVKRGRSLTFIESKVYVADKIVAMASITKSMIQLTKSD